MKHVHIYKKALGVGTIKTKAEDNEDEQPWSSGEDDIRDEVSSANRPPCPAKPAAKRITSISDVELYENRSQFEFEDGAGLSSHLPPTETPEQQVADASLYDFFRLVRFHGGRRPYLSWHEENTWPIVVMSPVLKLAEGPDFAFGARWALMQYHAWQSRMEFLDASDEEVKDRFRRWVETAACPWYLADEYAAANGRKRRVRHRAEAAASPTTITATTVITNY